MGTTDDGKRFSFDAERDDFDEITELSSWLGERAIAVSFRVTGPGHVTVDTLSDAPDTNPPAEPELLDPVAVTPEQRFYVLVEDRRASMGFRRAGELTYPLGQLPEIIETERQGRGRAILFEPVWEGSDG